MTTKRKYLKAFKNVKEELTTLSQAIKAFNDLQTKQATKELTFAQLLKQELGLEFDGNKLNMSQFLNVWTNRVNGETFAVYGTFQATYTLETTIVKSGKEVSTKAIYNVYYFDDNKELKPLRIFGLKPVNKWSPVTIANGLEQLIDSEYYTEKEMKSLDFISKLKQNNNIYIVRLDKDKEGNKIEVNEALFAEGKPNFEIGTLNF